MSATLPFDDRCWQSDIPPTTFPYSNILNLYLHLMEMHPAHAQRLARVKLALDQPPNTVDRATIDVLGKRFEVLKPGASIPLNSPTQLLGAYSPQLMHHHFQKKAELLDWLRAEQQKWELLTSPLAIRPRNIFAAAKTKSGWLATQNRQDLHRAFHAEVLLIHALSQENLKAELIWISLSPCRMCAALLEAHLALTPSQATPLYYDVLDTGPLAKNTLVENKIKHSAIGMLS